MDVAYSTFGDDPQNSPEKFTFIELLEHETESPKSSNETKTGNVLHSGSVKKVTVTMGMDGTLEIDKESGKPVRKGMYCSHAQMLFVFITACIIITGVGLLAFYVPDRCQDIGATEAPVAGESTGGEPRELEVHQQAGYDYGGGDPKWATRAADWAGRLSTDVLPKRYSVILQPFLTPDDATDSHLQRHFTFDGDVSIKVECNRPTQTITLHTKNLTLHRNPIVKSRSAGAAAEDLFQSYKFVGEFDFLVITLREELQVAQDYEISIAYSGELNENLYGFYRSSYTAANGEKRWIATTQMQPTDARRALPCFDEPAFKSVFDVEIIHRANTSALSNGIERVDKEPIGDNGRWVVTKFKRVREMSTYLLAFVVSDFKYEQATTTNGVLFRVWSRPEAVENTKYALQAGVDILNYFEEYFDFDYPLEKQDMVAIPDFAAGAMENWGLILYRETALLFDPLLNSASNQQRVAVVVSHELAHQWFGNLVTPEWWDDLWLNEGFASYVQYLGVDNIEPSWQMKLQFLVEELQPVFTEDALGTSHPVRVPVGAPSEINEIFDSISYEKGASIIRMLDNILTEDVFKEGLNYYLTERAYGNANSDDLWTVLTYADEDKGKNDVKKIMDTWTLQMGYPYVSFTRDSKTLTAVQKHFLNNPNSTVEDSNFGNQGYLWYIYLLYTHKSDQNYDNPMTEWMNKEPKVEISLGDNYMESDWYLVNVNQYGYYRVNYDTQNWERLSKQLEEDHELIPIQNRAALIDDAFNLARAGVIEQTTALNLTKYLTNEREYLPWEATLVVISYIRDMFSRYSGYGPLEKYMLKQIEPLYKELGWKDNITDPTNTHLTQYNRINALATACQYGMEDCVRQASDLYGQYMEDTSVNPITPNLKSVVYCQGIRYGGQDEWEFGWERFSNTSDSSERSKWLSALACSTEPWILSRFLEYSLDIEKITKGDAINVIRYVAFNYVGRALAWDFVRANWDTLFNEYSLDQHFPSIFKALTKHCNTQYDITEISHFYAKRNLSLLKKTVDMSLDRTRTNIRWMENNAEAVRIWFLNAYMEGKRDTSAVTSYSAPQADETESSIVSSSSSA
ncbi:aminopeptidase N-like isoform X2 [Asterias amurensis]|uniref:aminopeptidase N-like isoform X2 n=1 Tax=Asterias amurensis TaxID=7602 RepID=UPI003AB56CEF